MNSKSSKEFVKNTTRTCSKCETELPLDTEHFQRVKYFRNGYSFYCNECDKPKPRDD